MKKKIVIESEEIYPFYSIDDDDESAFMVLEIPIDKYEWVKRVQKDMEDVQEYLKTLVSKE